MLGERDWVQLRFRRCAPESLRQGAFSSASDVWMFGVTLWEMFSGGEEPWARLSPYLILQRLEQDRARLPRPPLCSRALYALALRCWAPHPADRPSFSNLEGLLQEVGAPASPWTHRLISPFFSPSPLHRTNILLGWGLGRPYRFWLHLQDAQSPREAAGVHRCRLNGEELGLGQGRRHTAQQAAAGV